MLAQTRTLVRLLRGLVLGLVLGLGVAATLGTATAEAAPVVYPFVSGSAHLTWTRSSDSSLVMDTTLALDGAFFTFDPISGEVVDFSITLPMSGAIALLQPWGGFDTYVIESASIVPGPTYSSIFSTMTGPTEHSFLIGPVDLAMTYSAFNSGGPPPAPVNNVPMPFVGASSLTGRFDTALVGLELQGVEASSALACLPGLACGDPVLATIPGAAFGEIDNLFVQAEISWGASLPPVPGPNPIPEPSAAIVFAVGLLIVAPRVRRSRRSQMSVC